MTDNQTRSKGCGGQTASDEYPNTLAEQMPQLRSLFENLASGKTPNFLDMMNAISEMVAFYTDYDNISAIEEIIREKMSGKKCLFCS